VVRATQTDIETAVEALRAGELVVFPTETVYGLGANAANPPAVRKIFEVKGRPPDHPVIVHLDDPRYLHRWVSNMPPVGQALADKFWPGPLTLILPKAENVNEIVTGGQDSIGIRYLAPHRAAAAECLWRRSCGAVRQSIRTLEPHQT